MCSMPAAILHADLDAFYASVEQRDRPTLRNRAMAVGGGVILSASYQARAMGVRTAMNIGEAKELCPNLISVPPRMDAYSKASKEVFEIFADTTPFVEPLSIDEAFLDVSGLGRLVGTPTFIAQGLRKRVQTNVGIAISVGVARTKFLAKVASGQSKPDGLLVVEPEAEIDFLHPLPVQALWGVGKVTAAKLNARGIHTVGDVAALGQDPLRSLVGPAAGHHLHALAHNADPRSVVTGKRRSSIGSQRALGSKPRTFSEIEAILLQLTDRVTRRLRDGERIGKTVKVRFRFGDFKQDTRSRSLEQATDSTSAILDAGHHLLLKRREEIADRGLTLLGLTIANLSSANAVQQSLLFDKRTSPSLDIAIDAVRDKYGTDSIGRATLLGQDPGITVPLLPDPR